MGYNITMIYSNQPTREIPMKKKEVLKRIIDAKGSCDWVFSLYRGCNICHFCPLGKLREKPNGDYYSCYEAVCGEQKIDDDSKIDKMYLEAAEKKLLDISVDEELGIDDGDYS